MGWTHGLWCSGSHGNQQPWPNPARDTQTYKSKKVIGSFPNPPPIFIICRPWFFHICLTEQPHPSCWLVLKGNRAILITLPLPAGLWPLGSNWNSLDFVSPGFSFLSHDQNLGTSSTTSGKSLDFLVLSLVLSPLLVRNKCTCKLKIYPQHPAAIFLVSNVASATNSEDDTV